MAVILIIDKRASRRRFLATVIAHRGHEARAANGGAQALEMIRTAPPDLVLIDVLMPHMGGYQFFHSLRMGRGLPPPRVVFLAAPYMMGEARLLARACGVNHVVPDIADTDALLAVIDAALIAPLPQPTPVPAADAINCNLLYMIVTRLCERVAELDGFNARLERKANASAAQLDAVRFALDREVVKRLRAEHENKRLRAAAVRNPLDQAL